MQKSDENEEKYQLGDYLFIQNQILGDRMADSKENYKLDLGSDFQISIMIVFRLFYFAVNSIRFHPTDAIICTGNLQIKITISF